MTVSCSDKDTEQAGTTLARIREYGLRSASLTAAPLSDQQRKVIEKKFHSSAGRVTVDWKHEAMTRAPALTPQQQAREMARLKNPSTDFKDTLTPNTMIRMETPRLVVRSVQATDGAQVHSVKGDPRVSKYQLYPPCRSKEEAIMVYTNGYIRDRVPLFRGKQENDDVERRRYVFAVTPKASLVPKPKSRSIPAAPGCAQPPPLPHANDVYIGNIGFGLAPHANHLELMPEDIPAGPACLRVPENAPFTWPDLDAPEVRRELDKWAATPFFELSPNYWGQGLMLEALLAVADFIFCDLGLGYMCVEPLTEDKASQALVRKFPGMKYETTARRKLSEPPEGTREFTVHVFTLSREDYLKTFGPSPLSHVGKRVCGWCYNPRAVPRGDGEKCGGCANRWYCSLECKAADWETAGAHGRRSTGVRSLH